MKKSTISLFIAVTTALVFLPLVSYASVVPKEAAEATSPTRVESLVEPARRQVVSPMRGFGDMSRLPKFDLNKPPDHVISLAPGMACYDPKITQNFVAFECGSAGGMKNLYVHVFSTGENHKLIESTLGTSYSTCFNGVVGFDELISTQQGLMSLLFLNVTDDTSDELMGNLVLWPEDPAVTDDCKHSAFIGAFGGPEPNVYVVPDLYNLATPSRQHLSSDLVTRLVPRDAVGGPQYGLVSRINGSALVHPSEPGLSLPIDMDPFVETKISISNSGHRVLFPVSGASHCLYLRHQGLDNADPVLLPHTPNTPGGCPEDAVLSGDGQYIAYSIEGQLYRFGLLYSTLDNIGLGWNPDISDDGNVIVYEAPSGNIRVRYMDSGLTKRVTRVGSNPSIQGDGTRVAYECINYSDGMSKICVSDHTAWVWIPQ